MAGIQLKSSFLSGAEVLMSTAESSQKSPCSNIQSVGVGQKESYRRLSINKKKYSKLIIIGVMKMCNISQRVCMSDNVKHKTVIFR